MIKIENVVTPSDEQWEAIVRGMRNPLNSWDKSDSEWRAANFCESAYLLGDDDLDLMHRLYKGGSDHRKYARMAQVIMDITASHFFWAELDTYKVATVRNSCSKMHTLTVKEFVRDDFSHEGITTVGGVAEAVLDITLDTLEMLRVRYNATKEKKYWRAILELLPMGYNIKATYSCTYETAISIIDQREGHKVDEWKYLIEVLKNLPHMADIRNGVKRI